MIRRVGNEIVLLEETSTDVLREGLADKEVEEVLDFKIDGERVTVIVREGRVNDSRAEVLLAVLSPLSVTDITLERVTNSDWVSPVPDAVRVRDAVLFSETVLLLMSVAVGVAVTVASSELVGVKLFELELSLVSVKLSVGEWVDDLLYVGDLVGESVILWRTVLDNEINMVTVVFVFVMVKSGLGLCVGCGVPPLMVVDGVSDRESDIEPRSSDNDIEELVVLEADWVTDSDDEQLRDADKTVELLTVLLSPSPEMEREDVFFVPETTAVRVVLVLVIVRSSVSVKLLVLPSGLAVIVTVKSLDTVKVSESVSVIVRDGDEDPSRD